MDEFILFQLDQIKDINEVRPGFGNQTFGHLLKKRFIKDTDENLAFTIMYNNHRSEVHLMAPNKRIRDLWIIGLQCLINQHARKSQLDLIKEESWVLNYFRLADKDKSNSLSKRECRKLLTDSLNVKVPNGIFESLFEQADKSQEGLLSPEEFLNFFQLLTRRKDLYEIMQKYTKNGYTESMDTIHMNVDELLSFLRTVQNQKLLIDVKTENGQNKLIYKHLEKPEQVKKLIDEFELDDEFKEKGQLGLDELNFINSLILGFRNMLLSSDFDIVKPLCSRQIYQNMTRPLCDYYINTSHNTYLFYSQLSGDSNPEAYNRALLAGCRAVELDCYDGPNGQPIVTHGYTLVKPCSFESIIRYMEPNLFKTSPYPVILNIENHCSIEQQKEMARILREILGDRLVTERLLNENSTTLPSPEDLKYKVLIRSRKKTKLSKQNATAQLDDDDDTSPDPLSNNVHNVSTGLFPYLENVSYREYNYAKDHYTPWHSSSLAENRFEKICREDPFGLILQTSWRIIRTYPDGFRQDSSNHNAVYAWNYGIQMAALNFQNEDDIMALSYGKFLDNGGCGYILKPNYLIKAYKTRYSPLDSQLNLDFPQVLTLTIISAQFLSRSNSTIFDIPDPYVLVSIHGLPCDHQTRKTKVIQNNGLDPIWNEKISFRIKYPKMALVYFSVYDYDAFTSDDKLAHFCLPLTMMQTGYRHIHLRTKNNDSTHSTIFVHVDIENDDENIFSTRL
ncbi:unnamed protein product [Rotaria sp. Silwood2]|nr:unnamed protein product [Rotaria sp. Silwood2]